MRLTLLPVLVGPAILLAAGYATTVVAPTADTSNTSASAAAPEYTNRAARGREVYADMGCVYCHTQQVRDTFTDSLFAERPTRAGDTVYDRPGAVGEARFGPDLACIADRVPGVEADATEDEKVDALMTYLRDPSTAHPGSMMPAYDFLGTADLRRLATYLVAQTCIEESGS